MTLLKLYVWADKPLEQMKPIEVEEEVPSEEENDEFEDSVEDTEHGEEGEDENTNS